MKYIACCSFGKDSLAQIIVAKEHNEPIDAVIYSEVMFTDEISGEFPEHRDFIYNVAIPKLKELYGIETIVLRSPETMWGDFHKVRVRGSTEGLLRGFPIPGACTINRDCKIPPIRKYLSEQDEEVIQYVGIAADEPKRLRRLEGTNKVSILAKYKVTEKQAKEICERAGLLSPIYSITNRNGCFFCPNASIKELRHIYFNHPELWELLRELQSTPNTSRECFTRRNTVFDYEKIFEEEIALYNESINDQMYEQVDSDDIFYDPETGTRMRSVTIQGGDVIQVPY
jgi:3'-phosphoadenosine 5'-phosphosulfate sulfotransferase (PAPS reductase)/FAD synthetase